MPHSGTRKFQLPEKKGNYRGIDFSRWRRRKPRGRSLLWIAMLIILVVLLMRYLLKFIK